MNVLENFEMNAYFEDFDQSLVLLLLAYCKQTRVTMNMQYMIPILKSLFRFSKPEFVGIWSFMQDLVVCASTTLELKQSVLMEMWYLFLTMSR